MSAEHILVLTNSLDVTSDYLCSRFKQEGIKFSRFDTDKDCLTSTFLYKSGITSLEWSSSVIKPEQIATVVYRRPKPLVVHKNGDIYSESHTAGEWSEAIEGFLAHIDERNWINHPARNSEASHKIEQLSRSKKHGLNIPRTLVTNKIHEAEKFIFSEKNGVIVKPLASGFIERANSAEDTIIYTNKLKEENLQFLNEIEFCPVLFQEMILKVIDVRVTMLDGIIVAIGIKAIESDGIQRLDIRRDNMSDVEYIPIKVPSDVSTSMRSLIQSYGLRFATLDFSITESGQWFFFEINPNGQWAWLDLYGNADIASVFIKQLKGN
jgi:glutathione synthase/RimK-type ligase-like ATP-grasp enzyme